MSTAAEVAWPANKVRETFVNFFQEKCGHVNYKSSPVVPHDDPTLLFANAGMNQFKPIFLGQADPTGPLAPLKRAANSQKCIRAGGKHNDLDDVGKDTYHHTFFEMLGNWSFGDYFKKEAIDWAWQLLTEVYGLPKDRLYVTYFAGGEGLPADEEARALWLRYLPPERVLPFDKKANFWEMGETGPCGPCSEIHFDRLGGRDAAPMVNYDDPTVIEIWNIVFMQFNREPNGSLRELPAKHIDTGMGFERLTSILQQKMSNYDTDVFGEIFAAISASTGAPPYTGLMHAADVDGRDMAYRVVGDHIRTLTFAITDGAVPSNEGRGYVLRRILRRAVRYAKQFLKAKPGFFADLVPTVVRVFAPAFPELAAKGAFVADIIREEEESFVRTLSKGIKTFEKRVEELSAAGERVVPGRDAFFLYDSMGFPVDLTQLMAAELGMTVDTAGFEAAMAEQKARSQGAQKFARGGLSLKLEAEQTAWLAKAAGAPVTVDAAKYVWHEECDSAVVAVYLGLDKDVSAGFLPPGTPLAAGAGASSSASSGEEGGQLVGLVLSATSFYAESGGQVGDTGVISSPPDAPSPYVFTVLDTQVYGGYVVHVGSLASGALTAGAPARAAVDYERRSRIGPNHTMTHVLNWALREVCGEGCDQRGSQVNADKLRFDYAISKAPTPEQLGRIEALVSATIAGALPVHTRVVPLAAARAIAGLRAVAGEAYPDPVRVVSVGAPIDDLLAAPSDAARWRGASIEFCGGTHIANTSRAGAFALLGDEALAKGVRRLTGATRGEAEAAHARGAELRSALASARSLTGAPLGEAIAALKQALDAAELSAATKAELREEHAGLCRVVLEEEKAAAAALAEVGKGLALAACAAAGGGAAAVVVELSAIRGDGKASLSVMEAVRKAHPGLSFLAVSSDGVEKVLVFASTPKAGGGAGGGLTAKDWASAVLAVAGGKGGGKEEQAQGTSKDVGAVGAMLEAARAFAQGK